MFETEGLVSAVTAVLSPDGPYGMLGKTLTNSLDGVWAEFFASPTPPGGTNWNAYTHEQLYEMLWQGADVGDVSAVAADWGRHSDALTEFADALRSQVEALPANWQGRASDLAGERLAELSDRVWNAGARAGTVQKAAGDAGDALALARNTMPPPPPDPMTLMTSAVGAGPMPPLEAVAVGGARIFTADAVAGASKAEAVRVMQRYEASLRNSSHQVVPAPPDAGATSAAGFAGGAPTGGVPWGQLVGGVPPGGQVGAGPGGGPGALGAQSAAEAAKRALGAGGLYPPPFMGGQAAEDEEKTHRRTLPDVHNRIFALDERASAPVIGAPTDREHRGDL